MPELLVPLALAIILFCVHRWKKRMRQARYVSCVIQEITRLLDERNVCGALREQLLGEMQAGTWLAAQKGLTASILPEDMARIQVNLLLKER